MALPESVPPSEKQSSAVGWLDDKATALAAVSRVLHQVAVCLRQLVSVSGWIVLLVSTITLALHPQITPAHMLPPGAGTAAIVQSLIKPRAKRSEESTSDDRA